MARCGDATCSCAILGGSGVRVTGGGTAGSPYFIEVDQAGQISVVDTSTIDLKMTPPSTEDNPAELTATLTAHLGDLMDVAKGVPANGQVLAWTGSQWAPVPPTTAAPNSIAAGVGITGDGSSGAPLKAVADSAGGLVVNPMGMALSATTAQRITNLENNRFDPQYCRCERTDSLTLVDATWTVPTSMNLGTTKKVGTRLTYGSGYITVLDTGVYAWETTATWATLSAQTSPFNRACQLQINDVGVRYGQTTHYLDAKSISGTTLSFTGTVACNANDKLRAAYYQNNPANASSSVVPNAFNVYRVA